MHRTQKHWILRQNYCSKTDQNAVRQLIMSQKFISCPWGGWGVHRENVLAGVFNNKPSIGRSSSGQDRKFVEEMQIGDIVLIPFAGKNTCIIARIVGDIDEFDTGLSWKEINDKIKLGTEGSPFSPVGRRIEIINSDFMKPSNLNQRTLTRMNASLIDKLNI